METSKTSLFIIVLMSFLLLPATHAQDKVFPESDAIWNIHRYENDRLVPQEYYFGLTGDTIINDVQYNKLYQLNDTTLMIDENDIYIGAIRQENRQVWFLINPPYSDSKIMDEYLLLDFSKEVGEYIVQENVIVYDPFFFYETFYGETQTRITRRVADVTDYSSDYKAYSFDDTSFYPSGTTSLYYKSPNLKWIEGVGSTAGLFLEVALYPMSFNDYYYKLACMKQGDEWMYLDNEYCNTCFCYDTSDIPTVKNNPFVVVPDRHRQAIAVSGTVSSPIHFELINLQGQAIKTERISSAKSTISYADITSGIYLYRIMQEGKVMQTGKVALIN